MIASRYGVDKSQMAHVGNSMRADIAGGNKYGVTTCLVRRAGTSMKLVKFVSNTLGVPTKGHLIRERLLERNMWRKHHVYHPGDQYYQLGEEPEYRRQTHPCIIILLELLAPLLALPQRRTAYPQHTLILGIAKHQTIAVIENTYLRKLFLR